MKKLFCILLTLILAVGMVTPALAATSRPEKKARGTSSARRTASPRR